MFREVTNHYEPLLIFNSKVISQKKHCSMYFIQNSKIYFFKIDLTPSTHNTNARIPFH